MRQVSFSGWGSSQQFGYTPITNNPEVAAKQNQQQINEIRQKYLEVRNNYQEYQKRHIQQMLAIEDQIHAQQQRVANLEREIQEKGGYHTQDPIDEATILVVEKMWNIMSRYHDELASQSMQTTFIEQQFSSMTQCTSTPHK